MNRLILFTLLAGSLVGSLEAASNPPNILILYLDDQNADYGCYGNTLTHTPHIDALAEQGVRYTRTYVANPVCSPSHSALFSGNYVTTLGCPHHRSHYIDQLPAGHAALPQVLEDVGYFSVNLSNQEIRWGASGKTDLNYNRNGRYFQHTQDFVFTEDHYEPATIFQGGVWANRKPGQPFFAYANIETGKAHGFSSGTIWAQKNGVAVDPADVSIPPYLADTPKWRTRIAQSLNAVSCTDYVVGAFLKGLELGGEADNTLVILATDHGRATMRHKQWLYETGIHVPMIIRWPGKVAPGSVETNLTSIIDIAATCIGAAGATRPPKMEGLDLLNADLSSRTEVFATRDGVDGVFDRSRTVVGRRFKYIRHYYPELPYINGGYANRMLNGCGMEKNLEKLTPEQRYFLQDHKDKEEFYDLTADPFEVNNLANDERFAAPLNASRKTLDDWMASTGDIRPDVRAVMGELPPDTKVKKVIRSYEKINRKTD